MAWFGYFQQQDTGTLRPLCPVSYSLDNANLKHQVVLDNYTELLSFLEQVSETERGEGGSKSSGFAKQLSTFSIETSVHGLFTK